MDLTNRVIAVVGLGYVGLPLAIEYGKKYRVIGFDIFEPRVAELNAGKHAVLLAQQFESKMNAVEFPAGDFQIPRGRRSRGDDHSIEPTGKGFIASNGLTIVELDAFLLK